MVVVNPSVFEPSVNLARNSWNGRNNAKSLNSLNNLPSPSATAFKSADKSADAGEIALHDDDFRLFGLPRQFALDVDALGQTWRNLLRQTHPDKFASQDPAAQRLAMQWTVRVNEAYQRLKHPLRRAEYLCALLRTSTAAPSPATLPSADFMQHMEWHEALDAAAAAQDAPALMQLQNEIAQSQSQAMQRLEAAFARALAEQAGPAAADGSALDAAALELHRLLFIEKIAKKAEASIALNTAADKANPNN